MIALAPVCAAPAAAPQSPSPTFSAEPTTSPAPVTSATTAPSASAQATAHTNATLGYRVALPAGYRLSSCGPWTGFGQDDRIGVDFFTPLSDREERALNTGDTPPQERLRDFSISAYRNADGKSAVDWARAQPENAGSRVDALTVGGHEAARITTSDALRAVSFAIRADGRIYSIVRDMRSEGDDTERLLGAVAATLETVALGPLPTPAPRTREGAQAVANALEKAFRERNADAVAANMRGCNLGMHAVIDPAGASFDNCCILGRSVFSFLEALRPALSSGAVSLVIDPTLRGGAPSGGYMLVSQWTEGGRTRQIDLMIDDRGQGWYLSGAIHHFRRGADGGVNVCYGPIWGGSYQGPPC